MKHKKSISLILALILAFTAPTVSYAINLDSAVVRSESYYITGPDGHECVCYALTNTSDYDLYYGLTAEFRDENKTNIGTSSAYISCLGGGQTTYIYAVNYFSQPSYYCRSYYDWGTTNHTSATKYLEYGTENEYDDSITFYASNTSSETICQPELTVVFKKDNEPVAITSGLFSDDDESCYIKGGYEGYLSIEKPAGVEYDTYSLFVTGYFDD